MTEIKSNHKIAWGCAVNGIRHGRRLLDGILSLVLYSNKLYLHDLPNKAMIHFEAYFGIRHVSALILYKFISYLLSGAIRYLPVTWETANLPRVHPESPSSIIRALGLKEAASEDYMKAGLILGLCPANERRHYKVTPSLIGWAQT